MKTIEALSGAHGEMNLEQEPICMHLQLLTSVNSPTAHCYFELSAPIKRKIENIEKD